jgi:putative transposase
MYSVHWGFLLLVRFVFQAPSRADKENNMSQIYHSLAHSKWDCKYHIIFIPKMRKNRLYGDIRPRLGQIFHALAVQKECKILEGYLKPDHVHMLIEIPPKMKVSKVVGFLKGKSAIAIAREFGGKTSIGRCRIEAS